MGSFRNLFKRKRSSITLDIDGRILNHCAVEAVIFNSGMLAKTLYRKESDVSIDDGQLDVWIVSGKTILDYPKHLLRMASGGEGRR